MQTVSEIIQLIKGESSFYINMWYNCLNFFHHKSYSGG
ncbi:MAG: hypothetical protein LBK97_03070 [Prevotellaceae bacterium]|nr:hypothetical protein [Prevotellaceae bacterium]